MKQRGFSLIETTVVVGVSAIVLTGAVVAGAAMTRRSSYERETNEVQQTSRAVKDMITRDLLLTGTGIGAARLSLPVLSGAPTKQSYYTPDVAYAVNVVSDPNFDALGLDPRLRSDMLVLFWGDTGRMVPLCSACTGTLLTTTSPPALRTMSYAPDTLINQLAFVTGPTQGIGCLTRVLDTPRLRLTATDIIRVGTTSPLVSILAPTFASDDPCYYTATAPFWRGDSNPNSYVMALHSSAFRIDWRELPARSRRFAPVFQYDPDGPIGHVDEDGNALNDDWQDISYDVEHFRVYLGVSDPAVADPTEVLWIPDRLQELTDLRTSGTGGGGGGGGGSGRGGGSGSGGGGGSGGSGGAGGGSITTRTFTDLRQDLNTVLTTVPDLLRDTPTMTTTDYTTRSSAASTLTDAYTDTSADLVITDVNLRPIHKLKRRVRQVEINLTVRSSRADLDLAKSGQVDELGFAKDGHKRRTTTFRVTPRGLAVSNGDEVGTSIGLGRGSTTTTTTTTTR